MRQQRWVWTSQGRFETSSEAQAVGPGKGLSWRRAGRNRGDSQVPPCAGRQWAGGGSSLRVKESGILFRTSCVWDLRNVPVVSKPARSLTKAAGGALRGPPAPPRLLTSRAQEPLALVGHHGVLGLQPAVWGDELLGGEDHLAPGLPELLQELPGPRRKYHVVAAVRARSRGVLRGPGWRLPQAPASHSLGNEPALLSRTLPSRFSPPPRAERWSPQLAFVSHSEHGLSHVGRSPAHLFTKDRNGLHQRVLPGVHRPLQL